MAETPFVGPTNRPVPTVTGAEMSEVDRVAVEEVGLDLRRMMEHAGRGLAEVVLDRRRDAPVTVLAGKGGNGGGGLACARHLANRSVPTHIVLDRNLTGIGGVTGEQLQILESMDVPIEATDAAGPDIDVDAPFDGVVVDALIGYGLSGAPRGAAAELIVAANGAAGPVVSLDIPSGVHATTGERPGAAIEPDVTATLALPKTGLTAVSGDLRLVDLSIPDVVYERVGLTYDSPFGDQFAVPLTLVNEK